MSAQNMRPTLIDGRRAITVLELMLGLGILANFLYALAFQQRTLPETDITLLAMPFGQIFGVGVVVSGAALMCGGFLGFLFGIPRTFQSSEGGTVTETEIRANTNLEQISDWLTKILVGVGLTQISEVPARLGELSAWMETNLGGVPGSGAFGIGIVIYFLICGFLIGFLWTRLFLPGAFREADVVTHLVEQVKQLSQQPDLNARARQLVELQLEPRSDVKPPTQQELNEAIAAADAAARAEIAERARNVRKEGWQQDKPELIEAAIPVFEALVSSDTEGKDYIWRGQLAFALKDKPNPDYARAESLLTQAITRRGKQNDSGFLWYEINRALCRILQDPNFEQGQPSADDVRERIIDDLKASISEWEKASPPIKEITDWLALNGLTADAMRT